MGHMRPRWRGQWSCMRAVHVSTTYRALQASTVGAAFLTKTIPELNVKFEIW